jgi:hypothetical protein
MLYLGHMTYIKFFCVDCDDWQSVTHGIYSEPRCSNCAETFTCGDCGYDIDLAGNCQRPGGHT